MSQQNPPSIERLYALDNLRAVMMWLGIVIHVAVIHMAGDSPVAWVDNQTSIWADLLVFFIHSFRMPVFFVLAGFFVSLLVERRGLLGMLKNRFMRLGLPFAVLWPVIYVTTGVLVIVFVHLMARGTWGYDESLFVPREGSPRINTVHMWFLLMLMWFSVFTFVLTPPARRLPESVRNWLANAFIGVSKSPWAFLILACPLAGLGSLYKDGVVTASTAFFPPLAEWLHNGLFFVFGLALYVRRTQLLALYQRRWLPYALIGLGFLTAALALKILQIEHKVLIPYYEFWRALAYNCGTWLWSFALIGLFLRYFDRQNRAMEYLSQSSYWVYLIHFPVTIGLGACLYGLTWPVWVKMPINIVITTVFALMTYHLLVRSTGLGQLLNGRRYPFNFFGQRLTRLDVVTRV